MSKVKKEETVPQLILTMGEMIDSLPALNDLCTKELPIDLAVQVEMLVLAMQPKAKIYEEKRSKLLQKYGSPSPKNPDRVVFKGENGPLFIAEHEKLYATKVVMSDVEKIDKQRLLDHRDDNDKQLNIKASTLFSLRPLFIDTESNKEKENDTP